MPLPAQVSLTTAVDLSLSHSPKIRMAEADLAKAKASLKEARDAYVPAANAGAGLGESYGYSPQPPTLFTFSAESLAFNRAQPYNIRAGRFGIQAANLSLLDARESVSEDAVLSFLAVQHDQQREQVLQQENEMAARLVAIVQDRFDAGRETAIDLTSAKLTAAQFRLAGLRAQDDTAHERDHLSLLMGLAPNAGLVAEGTFPSLPAVDPPSPALLAPATPAVSAAIANAAAKQQVADGGMHFLYRPQFSFVVQYNRYATFTKSFTELQNLNPNIKIGPDEGAFGVQITLPLFDRGRQARAQEAEADALHAHAEADNAQRLALDGQLQLHHNVEVLRARVDVAQLEQQLAQLQLDALTAQLNVASANPNAPQMSPKDEQNSRIAEREKYLALLDANFQLQQAQVSLLRQSGQLESWLRRAATQVPAPVPAPPPQP